MVEIAPHIIPAAVTDAGILDSVRRFKLVDWIGEAGNKDHRNAAAPRQPAQTAGKSDEHIGVLDEVDSFLQRQIASEIFRPKWNVIPSVIRAVLRHPVNAENPVALRFQIFLEVNKTKRQNSPTLKTSQKFVKWGQWFNTRSNSEKVINFEITDFSMYGDFLPKIDASFL